MNVITHRRGNSSCPNVITTNKSLEKNNSEHNNSENNKSEHNNNNDNDNDNNNNSNSKFSVGASAAETLQPQHESVHEYSSSCFKGVAATDVLRDVIDQREFTLRYKHSVDASNGT